MIIILGLLVLVLVCLGGWIIASHLDLETTGWMVSSFMLILLLATLLIWIPVSRMGITANIAEFKSVQETFSVARSSKDMSSLEIATIQRSVADQNAWLASSQYWAKNPLVNWYYPKSILALKPIK